VKSRLFLDVVVRESSTIFKLFSSKDQPLLIRGDPFLVLDLGLHILDSVRRLNFKGDCLACQGLHEDLHTSSEPQDQVECGLLLDVVVGQGPAILQLLSGKDQPLLVRGDPFLVLDLGLHILDGVRRLNLKSDCLACQGLHEDLHTSPEPEDQVECRLLLDVVVREGPAILKLLASKDQPLLIRRDAFLVLDLGLHIFDGVGRLHFQGDRLASQGFHKDLHLPVLVSS